MFINHVPIRRDIVSSLTMAIVVTQPKFGMELHRSSWTKYSLSRYILTTSGSA
jgi:hypothetical protein